jgi:competence protein ComEA
MKINIVGKKIQMRKKTVIFLTAALILFFSAIGYIMSVSTTFQIEDFEDPLENETEPDGSDNVQEETALKKTIKVYVTGCVKNPGIYELEEGQIIYDAIVLAGGFTEDANKNINLVFKLYENVTLRIKSIHERDGESMPSGLEIIDGDGGVIAGQDGHESSEESYKRININTANANQLATLPGIGPSTANAIVEYRRKNGPFQKIEDIMNVPGIKENKFSQIRNLITVE